ncbi:hypothetical protein EP073_06955 [Geovibrio thiophilus]|uniref:PilZ domain-containing protein n=1 Tax=Geovibrio thiophilus TaxID=139438 RepID=A0A3R5YZ96_9BACT|nr:hypothetical protein [Geovibrio thiophilus]QAR33146.1 hypothetical protein EP073_06955 [Geovibrio thiophilus]
MGLFEREKRSHQRTQLRTEFFIRKEGEGELFESFKVVDISENGMRVKDNGKLRGSAVLEIGTYDKVKNLGIGDAGEHPGYDTLFVGIMKGRAVWFDEHWTGIEIYEISKECAEKLRMLAD